MGELQKARKEYEKASMMTEELEDMVESIQGHFRNLFIYLLKLIPMGILDGELSVVETNFGTIRLADDDQVIIDAGVWEQMCDEFKRLDGIKGDQIFFALASQKSQFCARVNV